MALALTVFLVVQMAFAPLVAKAVSVSPASYNLKITTPTALQDGSEPEFVGWTGAPYRGRSASSMSGDDAGLSEVMLRLSIPKQAAYVEAVQFSEVPEATESWRSEDEHSWSIEYYFDHFRQIPWSARPSLSPSGTAQRAVPPSPPPGRYELRAARIWQPLPATFTAKASMAYKLSKQAKEGVAKQVGDQQESERVAVGLFEAPSSEEAIAAAHAS